MEVSIVIATYNMERYVGRAIRSAIEQSYPKERYEIIVVDDGSKDHTHRILHSYEDAIKIIKLKKHKGLPYARNTGIERALGRYVLYLDADDYMHEDLLKVEHLFISHNKKDIHAVACDYYTISDDEIKLQRVSAKKEPIACGVMFDKDKLIDIGLYDESFLRLADEDMRIRYENKFNIYYIPLPLYRYRRHDSNITNDTKKMSYYKKRLEKKHKLKLAYA